MEVQTEQRGVPVSALREARTGPVRASIECRTGTSGSSQSVWRTLPKRMAATSVGFAGAASDVDGLLGAYAPDEDPPGLLRDHQLGPVWCLGVTHRHLYVLALCQGAGRLFDHLHGVVRVQRGGPQPVKCKGIAVHIRTLLDFTIVNVALPSIQRDLASALLTATRQCGWAQGIAIVSARLVANVRQCRSADRGGHVPGPSASPWPTCWPPGWCRPGRRTPTCRSRIICSVITPAGSPDHGLSPQGAVPRRRGCGGPAGARPDGVMPVRLCGARLTIFFARTVPGSPVPTCTSRR